MRKFYILSFSLLLIIILFSCHAKKAAAEEDKAPADVRTPVTVTTLQWQPLTEYIDLNATSAYLQNNYIKATTGGYIKSVNVHLGQYVTAGQSAFTLKTKEAQALGNTINMLDSSFRFSGMIRIKALQTGYITQLNHQLGDYVQDGEQLAVLSNANSFGFLLNLPYELRRYINNNKTVPVLLPDGTKLNGTVASIMPSVDSASQTQSILIRVASAISIPQNLIARVRIIKNEKSNVASLPKEAVLTDESQASFWVMKLMDSSTAVKVPVIKGMEAGDRVEIVSPKFSAEDKILVTGNYGLPDTAKVIITKQ